ncbi:MAG: 1-phosphofructokinase [Oscillospiraceae bacterium]|nr:1-phosphofructokinase [Candidatus Ruminococcus equi]
MIYTVTFNPALDLVINTEKFLLGEINRSKSENIFVGGKGINVSIVLKELGMESTALGFVAGFTGEKIEKELKELQIKSDFVKLSEGDTRINIKIKSDIETDLNTSGAKISDFDLHRLYKQIENLKDGDVLIISGSVPKGTDNTVYERILKKVEEKNVLTVVDATGELLTNTLKYHPFLIKPNLEELGEIFNTDIKSDEDIKMYAEKLQSMGAKNVLVSMSKQGSFLLTETGEGIRQGCIKGKLVNSSGSGDSMVAGFVAGFLQKHDMKYALSLASACGSATAFSLSLAKHNEIFKLLNESSETFCE